MIEKTFRILKSIAANNGKTIDTISADTGIPRSSVQRILQSLIKEGIIASKPKYGYILTPLLLTIAISDKNKFSLLDLAIPVMREISEKTRETVSLNIISGYERICIFRIEGDLEITRNIKIGEKAPLFIGSAGKIIASGLSVKETEKILEKYLETNVIQAEEIEKIKKNINQVKLDGFAVSSGERLQGSASMAVPIKDALGNIVASLSIASIKARFTEENKEKFLKLLLKGSQEISSEFGFFL